MFPPIEHREIQTVAKAVLAQLAASIHPSDTERTLAERAVSLLAAHGITETWYYNCPALVLLGTRSCESLSGRDYQPDSEPVGDFNVITVDLSPMRGGLWGDCARTIPVENGRFTSQPQAAEFKAGLEAQELLHQSMRSFVTPTTTFAELFAFSTAQIASLGFQNLDFRGNLGHSIAAERTKRCYIEVGNSQSLGSVRLFTFEPHIRQLNGTWGFKHEEIYYFGPDRQPHAL
ncbi:aminopeptidase P family protein [Luteimonas sp. BDR2-5]|uniref:M24 family metallopeptidase n=1 Tax=Proluteimonas luteida TaxID=2878685 RepID=UPI001E54F383|nr:M24 family metallopeptidase [Luteimonas sp. BDR2-5]MCD9029188.1 aminopeptidase P family protein [Luteimonas sp. BDR2-5]